MLKYAFIILLLFSVSSCQLKSQPETFRPDNPVTETWLKKNLRSQRPRLILSPKSERILKRKIKDDEVIATYYQHIKRNADDLLNRDPLERKQIGRRLLKVSREALRRVSQLALVYRLEKEDKYLKRLDQELQAVCGFADWNPSHFLDVAEMAMAVSLGLDWAGEWLPPSTVKLAHRALKNKALEMSWNGEGYNWWIVRDNNWNQVCHAGMVAAALILAEEEPELATQTIARAIDKIPIAMATYAPDGAYPEGPSYWGYGTGFNLMLISMFETALGTDFRLVEAPGFMESADYRILVCGPEGDYNYFDAGREDSLTLSTRGLLAWFAQKTGDALYADREVLLHQTQRSVEQLRQTSRTDAMGLIWLSSFSEKTHSQLPNIWKADGLNPLAIFRADTGIDNGFYLAAKGGSAYLSHGNMDAGSFIFDLHGVRWSLDPGNQSYHYLESTIGSDSLWTRAQDGFRWKLLTKGNRFHSTLSVNDQRHVMVGQAPILDFELTGDQAFVSFDLTEIFEGQLEGAQRTFTRLNYESVRITDEINLGKNTQVVSWAMMTQAEVETTAYGALLKQDGQKLKLTIKQPEGLQVSVVSLDPPPLPYDKQIPHLKRIEIRIPAYILAQQSASIIQVELSDS
jgi:hypothetical protein